MLFRSDISEETFLEILRETYSRQAREIKSVRPRTALPDDIPDNDARDLVRRYYNRAFGARPVNEAVTEYIDNILIP